MMKYLLSIHSCVCAVSLLVLTGCANFHVTIPDSDPIRLEYRQQTMHAYLWGFLLKPQVLEAECGKRGINDLMINRTLAHDIVGVFTLGIWIPMNVGYRCLSPEIREGTLPVPNTRLPKQ